MIENVKVFGAALDALDDPDRVALKRAWVDALAGGRIDPDEPRDPYDAIALPLANELPDTLEAAGKMEIRSLLTPRPLPEDMPDIQPEQYRFFMENHIEFTIMRKCTDFMKKHIIPAVSGMFAVDHSLTAGAYLAHAERHGRQNVTLLVLDSHFDVIPTRLRIPSEMKSTPFPTGDTLNCGNFIGHIINSFGILPENVIVIGPSDYPPDESPGDDDSVRKFRRAYLSFISEGVKLIPKSAALSPSFLSSDIESLLDEIRTPYVYVSLDADAGSCACMNAVRFMDTVGLSEETIVGVAKAISRRVEEGMLALAGFDISEVDIHLLGLPGADGSPDRTAQVCARFVRTLLGVN